MNPHERSEQRALIVCAMIDHRRRDAHFESSNDKQQETSHPVNGKHEQRQREHELAGGDRVRCHVERGQRLRNNTDVSRVHLVGHDGSIFGYHSLRTD